MEILVVGFCLQMENWQALSVLTVFPWSKATHKSAPSLPAEIGEQKEGERHGGCFPIRPCSIGLSQLSTLGP